jgi:hypothetical protein
MTMATSSLEMAPLSSSSNKSKTSRTVASSRIDSRRRIGRPPEDPTAPRALPATPPPPPPPKMLCRRFRVEPTATDGGADDDEDEEDDEEWTGVGVGPVEDGVAVGGS